jgi:hypothetical protein
MLILFYLIEISFIPVPDVSGDPDERFACCRSQRPLSTKHPNLRHAEQWLIRVVFAGARNHCEGSVVKTARLSAFAPQDALVVTGL